MLEPRSDAHPGGASFFNGSLCKIMKTMLSLILPANSSFRFLKKGRMGLGFRDGLLIVRDPDGTETRVTNNTLTEGAPVHGVKATQTITSDTTAPSNGDTVVIGGQTYTFKTALSSSTAANEVLIGVSAAVALDNLKAAINKAAGGGTTYGSDTVANASVAATTNTDTTQVVEALVAGVAGNSIAVSETSSHLSWGAATLENGVDCTPATKGEERFATNKRFLATADMDITSTSGWVMSVTSTSL